MTVESPTLLPTVKTTASPPAARERGMIEIEFSSGVRVRLHGTVEAVLLKRVLKILRR